MSFKEYIEEAVPVFKVDDYIAPPPRAKFNNGNIVVVRDAPGMGYLSYHSKKALPYLNQVGEVVGYKNVPGAYSKFAIKFGDGAVVPIHSQFIFGPFKDLQVAKKYTDPTVDIDPHDYGFKQAANNANVPTDYESKPDIEEAVKQVITNPIIGFKWLDQPLEVKAKNGQWVNIILATKDYTIDDSIKNKTGFEPILPGKLVFMRRNRLPEKTLKPKGTLKITRYIGDYGDTNTPYLLESLVPIKYVIRFPVVNRTDELFAPEDLGVTKQSIAKVKDTMLKVYASYNQHTKINRTKVTDEYLIENVFRVVEERGNKVIKGDVRYFEVGLSNPYSFKNYIVDGSFIFDVNDAKDGYRENSKIVTQTPFQQLNDLSFLPMAVTGTIDIDGKETNITSLKGMPATCAEAEPDSAYSTHRLELRNLKITDLKGASVPVKGSIFIADCMRLKSLEGLPQSCLGSVRLDNLGIFDLTGITQEIRVRGRNDTKYIIGNCKNLASLKGLPATIPGIYIDDCISLQSLEGCPSTITGDLVVRKCKSLTSVKGAPSTIGGNIALTNNHLRSLEGLPEEIGGSMIDIANNQLSSLVGSPKKLLNNDKSYRVYYDFSNNPLTTLRGIARQEGLKYDGDSTKFDSDEKIKKELEDLDILDNMSDETKGSFEDLLGIL
jgi:hypothetical protein